MSSFDNDWISFDGNVNPVRVPGQVIVKGPKGYQLTAGQRGEFSQVFRQFGTSVKTSSFPNGFHSRNMTLADGSTISMSAINGVYRSVITPVVGGGSTPAGFGGFTFLPAYAYWTRPASNVRWRIEEGISTLGVVTAPRYKADKPPTEVKDKLFQWRSLDQIPGTRSWDCQGLYPGGRLNWRGPPTKYFAFGDYPDWSTLSCAGIYPYPDPEKLAYNTPIVRFLHRPSEVLWVDGAPKFTAVKYIFSACLHRPDPDADIVSGNTIVRVFGAQALSPDGGAVFKVFDLAPANVSLTGCTLQNIKDAIDLVIHAEYELPGDYETNAIFLPPQQVGHWKFLYAPEFNRTGSKMAAAISRRTFGYFVDGGAPQGLQMPFYFSSVCEVDPTTFAISNERWSHGPMPGPTPATTPNTRYVGCDYLGDEFVTLWVSGVSGTSGSTHTLQHSKHGAVFVSLDGTEFLAAADLAKDFIYVIASLGINDPSLSEFDYWVRPPYSSPSHDIYFRGEYIHLSGQNLLSAGAPGGAITAERVDPPIVVGTPYYSENGSLAGYTYSGDRSLPLHGQVAVVGNNWSTAHWVGEAPGAAFTWDSELGRMDVVGYPVIDGVMDMSTTTRITDTRPGGPYTPGIFTQFYTTVALIGSAFGESLRGDYSYRAYAFTRDGEGVFLSSSPDPYPGHFVTNLGSSPRLPLLTGAAWFVRIYPEVPKPPPAGEVSFIAWPSPNAWVSDTPRTPDKIHFHVAPVFI